MIVPISSPAADTTCSDVSGYNGGMWSVTDPAPWTGITSVELSAPVAA